MGPTVTEHVCSTRSSDRHRVLFGSSRAPRRLDADLGRSFLIEGGAVEVAAVREIRALHCQLFEVAGRCGRCARGFLNRYLAEVHIGSVRRDGEGSGR